MLYYKLMYAMISVFIGGGLGAILRYAVSNCYAQSCSLSFLYSTLTVNVVGSALLGFLIYSINSKMGFDNNVKLLLTVGFCGGFTTFSAFSLESVGLLRNGHVIEFLLYALGSVFICLIGSVIGAYFAKYV